MCSFKTKPSDPLEKEAEKTTKPLEQKDKDESTATSSVSTTAFTTSTKEQAIDDWLDDLIIE